MPLGLLNSTFTKDLRKSILERNLNPTTEATLGGVASLNVNRGLPAATSLSQGDYIPLNQNSVTTLGHYFLKDLGIKNRYAPPVYPIIEITDTLTIGGNLGTYSEVARTNASNSGLFDLRQFVLGSPSLQGYNDTPLGLIGAEQLKFNLEANIAQNTIKNTTGRINLNLFSLLNGEEFLIRDYQITEFPNTGLGFVGNLLEKYTGVELPKSIIPKDAFGFVDSLFDGKMFYGDCNLEGLGFKDQARMDGKFRNDTLLRYTGRGNRVQLFNLLGINKYRPNYDDPNGPDTGLNRVFGFLQQRRNNQDAGYNTLEDTRRSTGTLPIMLTQGIADPSSISGNFGDIGKVGAFTQDDPRSVLQPNGLPKITWTDKDKPGVSKKFMFSIENLAWKGHTEGLPECEIGNGDLTGDDKLPGRIMWFPPYGLEFDENVTVAWDRVNFIGRGEPIFTYNNTTRSGTIRFKVVVDHPSIINELRKSSWSDDGQDFVRFFKGCTKPTDYVKTSLDFLERMGNTYGSPETTETVKEQITQVGQKNFGKRIDQTTKAGGSKDIPVFKIFYANNSSVVDTTYQNPGKNNSDAELGFLSTKITDELNNLTSDTVDSIDITICTFTSSRGGTAVNTQLLKDRFDSASQWIKNFLNTKGITKVNISVGISQDVPNTTMSTPDDPIEVNSRYASLGLSVNLKDLITTGSTTVETTTYSDKHVQDTVQTIMTKVFYPVWRECDYFYYLEKNAPFVYSQMKEKLKYFHPGFHSTTPEGLNSRLTFLHQCTRQGPAIDTKNITSSNLAFGRPPICILRIGDFFHTKMVIESMGIQYDEGVLWDLNPEGIGVQPRIASVSLTVSYLGGHSLMTPIRELQNALGYHFYANTEVFQHEPKFYMDTKTNTIDTKEFTTASNTKPTQRDIEEDPNAPQQPFIGPPNSPYNFPPQQPFVGPPANPYGLNNFVDSPIQQGTLNNINNYGNLNTA